MEAVWEVIREVRLQKAARAEAAPVEQAEVEVEETMLQQLQGEPASRELAATAAKPLQARPA